jgi:membrane protease YdiL (CAAX protease family)
MQSYTNNISIRVTKQTLIENSAESKVGMQMENHSGWKAKISFACYLALGGGILLGSFIAVFIFLGMNLDIQNLTFPAAFISLPINESIILGITFLFARYKGASLKELGLKKPNLKILLFVSVGAFLLLLLAVSISAAQESVLGPDPLAQELNNAVLPRNLLQLVVLIGLSMALVGPAEELAFRGFVQRGFESSFGKTGGLVVASILFGLLHGLNSLRAIIPVTVVSLVLGYVWQKTDGNTTTSAWMHGLYDSIALAIAFFATV